MTAFSVFGQEAVSVNCECEIACVHDREPKTITPGHESLIHQNRLQHNDLWKTALYTCFSGAATPRKETRTRLNLDGALGIDPRPLCFHQWPLLAANRAFSQEFLGLARAERAKLHFISFHPHC